MRLLILTQKVDINDDVLGFFHGWITEFAKNCEKITVVCLKKGEYNLPENVRVLSLGKETGESKIKYLVNFYKYIWQERKNYDSVFVHMNQIYVILGAVIWRLLGKKIGLWYAHGNAGSGLRLAEKLANYVFTPTPDSFRLESHKINVLGHGIDTDKFNLLTDKIKNSNEINIITIGRISPSKDYETLILAIDYLRDRHQDKKIKVKIIGKPGDFSQKKYLENLHCLVAEKKLNEQINFIGSIPNKDIASYLQSADLFVNMSHTGGLDKAVLEAMSSGIPVLTCNETFEKVLGDLKNKLMFPKKDWRELANRIKYVVSLSAEEQNKIGADLRKIVEADHELKNLIEKIILLYGENSYNVDSKQANILKYQNSEERKKFALQPGKMVKTDFFKRLSAEFVKRGEKILDIGGGAGVWADIIRSNNITDDIYALDISEDILRERNKHDKIFVGDMEKLPFTDEFFDRTMFFASLHHANNTKAVLNEAWRVTKKDGCLFLWEPVSLKMRILGRSIEPVNNGVEYRLSLPYLFYSLNSLGGKYEYVYYEGFIKRWLPKNNFALLKKADRLEEMINNSFILKYPASWLSQSVIIIIKK